MTKYLTNLDLVKSELEGQSISEFPSDPVSPVSGQVYRNTTDNHVYFYDGSSWIDITDEVVNRIIMDVIRVADDSYDSTHWDNNFEVPTKNAIRDVVEYLTSTLGYSDEEAQDAVGNILSNSSTISFTYDDTTPAITADVIESGLNLENIGGELQLPQIENIPLQTLLGNGTGGANPPTSIELSNKLEISAGTLEVIESNFDLSNLGGELALSQIEGISPEILLGNPTGSITSPQEITLSSDFFFAASQLNINESNLDISNLGGTLDILSTSGDLPLTRIEDIPTNTILGNTAGSSSPPEPIEVGIGLEISGGALNVTLTEYSDEASQDAVGSILLDSSTIDFTYNDSTPSITADVIESGIDIANLSGNLNLTQIENIPIQTLLGNGTGSASSPTPIDLSSKFEISAGTLEIIESDFDLENLGGTLQLFQIESIPAQILLGNPTAVPDIIQEITLSNDFIFAASQLNINESNLDIANLGGTLDFSSLGGELALSQIEDIGVQTVIGNSAGSAGAPSAITLGDGLEIGGGLLYVTFPEYTDEKAQDAVGSILTDSTTVDFTYNDGSNTITATVIESGLYLSNIGGNLNLTQIEDIPIQTLLGNTTGSASNPSPIGLGTEFEISPDLTIITNSLTYDKLWQLSDGGLLGHFEAGNVTEVSIGNGLEWHGDQIRVDQSVLNLNNFDDVLAISKGGTGQTTAAAAFQALSPLTTKGDITVFSTAPTRLPIGSNDTLLVADSTQSRGMKWATLVATQIPSLDAAKITSGQFAASRVAASVGNDQILFFNGSSIATSSNRLKFDGTDFSLVNPTAATSGTQTQNSPFLLLQGTKWRTDTTASETSRLRISNIPQVTNLAHINSPTFNVEGYSFYASTWNPIFSVGQLSSDYLTTRVRFSSPHSSGHGGLLDVSYLGEYIFRDLSGNKAFLSGVAFGKGSGLGYEQFWVNDYQPEIRAFFNGKILFAAGRPAWKYGDNVGNSGSEFVQSDLPLSIGVGGAGTAMLQIRRTTEQMRIEYDASNYYKTTVSSAGLVTFDAVGSSSAFVFADDVTFGGNVLMTDGKNITTGTTTGMKIAGSTTQKIGFHNATPTVQRASSAQQAAETDAATTGAGTYGYTQAQANGIVTLLNEIRFVLVEKGLMKGNA